MGIPDSDITRVTCGQHQALILLPVQHEAAATLDLDPVIESSPRCDQFDWIIIPIGVITIDAHNAIT